MHKLIKITIFTLAGLALLACSSNPNSPFARPSDPHGLVVLSQTMPVKQLFEVTVTALNGQEIPDRSDAIWLKPGKHTLKGIGVVDLRYAGGLDREAWSNRRVPPIEIDVEAGKRYYLALDASANHRKDWKLVVWKVEDMSS